MKLYDKIKKSNINLSSFGFEWFNDENPYYCTPKDADVLGVAGVDGIHYCTVPQFGEMIFAVSPMNFGDCVHPIARSFEDLLRLLLSGADLAALEQCYAWDGEQFKAFLSDNPLTDEQQTVLERIRGEYKLDPMKNAFEYIKKLQAEFDYSEIPYTEDYYDIDMNPAAPEYDEPWEVYFDGDSFGKRKFSDRPGKEISLDARFTWNDEKWYVPAVYVFPKGIVVDFCVEIAPEREKAFIQKWEPLMLREELLTREMHRQIDNENPLNIEFRPQLNINGKLLKTKFGTAISWIPLNCLPEDEKNDNRAKRVIKHYGLDETRVWSFHRRAFLWATAKKPIIKSASLKLKRDSVQIDGIHFTNPSVGDVITFVHPKYGTRHKLTVLEYERQELSAQHISDAEYEFPTHHTAMTYKLEPNIPNKNFQIRDCIDNDEPKRKSEKASATQSNDEACAIGIIGGADGPTVMILACANNTSSSEVHTTFSALHFELQENIEWKLVFNEKPMEDIEVDLLP